MSLQFEPLNGHVVVVKTHPEAVSAGGIIIPESAQKESETAIVHSVCGEWVDDHGTTRQSRLKSGDAVLISKYTGENFKLANGRQVTILKESSVLTVLRDFIPQDSSPLPALSRVASPNGVMLGGDGVETQKYDAIPA